MNVPARPYPATFSDLALLPADAELTEGTGGMIAARCPSRPDYADGHAVYVPLEGPHLDLDSAVELWDIHVSQQLPNETLRLCLEGSARTLGSLHDPDWRCERRVVLQRAPGPVPYPTDPRVRRCERLRDWEALLSLWSEAHRTELADFVVWRAEQLRRRAAHAEGGMWVWFDAHGHALACAGAYRTGPLWRLQEVMTHPAHRRRGLGRAVCASLLEAGGDSLPTVVAHHASAGQRLYESLGFAVVGEQHIWTARRV